LVHSTTYGVQRRGRKTAAFTLAYVFALFLPVCEHFNTDIDNVSEPYCVGEATIRNIIYGEIK